MNKSKLNISAVTKNWPYARFCIIINMLIYYTFLLFGYVVDVYLWRSAGWVYTSETLSVAIFLRQTVVPFRHNKE